VTAWLAKSDSSREAMKNLQTRSPSPNRDQKTPRLPINVNATLLSKKIKANSA